MIDIISNIWGTYTEEQEKIVNEWQSKLTNDITISAFRDAEFLDEFLIEIPDEEQFKYVENTVNYLYGKEYNPDYVLVFRRAVPSIKPKPEAFWSTEYRVPRFGLKKEIPLNSAQRLHSVIMISTLSALKKHGEIINNSATSDGEISIDYNKEFNDFLFMYKPFSEIYELKKYLNNGGKSLDEVLEELSKNAEDRIKRQFDLSEDINHKKR